MDEAARTRLAAWLSAEAGAPVEITGMGLLSGGAVQQNWALDVTLGGAPQRWVLRTDNAAVLAVSHPRTAEFALLRAAHAAGVAVPAPLFCCTTATRRQARATSACAPSRSSSGIVSVGSCSAASLQLPCSPPYWRSRRRTIAAAALTRRLPALSASAVASSTTVFASAN